MRGGLFDFRFSCKTPFLPAPLIGYILGLYRGYIGIMEKKMETTVVYWGYIGLYLLLLRHSTQYVALPRHCTAHTSIRRRLPSCLLIYSLLLLLLLLLLSVAMSFRFSVKLHMWGYPVLQLLWPHIRDVKFIVSGFGHSRFFSFSVKTCMDSGFRD